MLSSNPSVSPGAIVPDPSGFVGTGLANAADAFYDGVFLASTPISSSGIFFSFQVTATAVGSGTLSFSSVAATLASDPDQNDQFTPDTQGLSFTVESSSTIATPEPSTWVLALSGLVSLALLAFHSARRRCTVSILFGTVLDITGSSGNPGLGHRFSHVGSVGP